MRKVHNSGADQFGRWSFITLAGRHKRKVTVVTAYRVCKNSLAMAGENTCWMQQWRSPRKQGVVEPDPRNQFMTDFESFLKDHLNKNEEIIVGMDVNKEDLPEAEIEQLMQRLDMIDVHSHLHSKAKAPSTYQQGKIQLNFFFITSGILPSPLTARFLQFNVPFVSDHCTI
eukprot:5062549-Ditylum_brightwellii.AAC.1